MPSFSRSGGTLKVSWTAFACFLILNYLSFAVVGNDESLYMLADSYYRSGKANVAYSLLTEKHTMLSKSAKCLFLLAKCCFDLEKYGEALNTLTGPFNNNNNSSSSPTSNNTSSANNPFDTPKQISADELIKFFGDISSFVAQLLGAVYLKLDGAKTAAHYYTLSLKINPFLWSSYEKLLQIDPSAVEPAKLFASLIPSSNSLCVSNSSNLNSVNSLAQCSNAVVISNHVLHTSSHHQQQTQQQQSQGSCVGPLRRSSRLYSNNCIKENNTSSVGVSVVGKTTSAVAVAGLVVGQPNNAKPIISRTPTKRSRRKISFDKSSGGGGSEKDLQNENQSHIVANRTNENLKGLMIEECLCLVV